MTCDSPFYVLPKAALQKVPVPCGRCPPCKQRRVNGWVFRMLQEEKRSTHSHFITLTYDTRFVPISNNGFMTLRKDDFQKFMKRLRKATAFAYPNHRLKYYAVGEYGTNNRRPHYHAILFNLPDVELLQSAWSLDGQQLGSIHIGKVTGDSIAYCMKYIDKARRGPEHQRDDREPEFPLMSKGLGSNYLTDDVISYHKSDLTRLYLTREGGHKIALPRYYKNKIYDEDEQKEQQRIIQSAVIDQEIIDRRMYRQLYGDSNAISFEAWMESKKYGRYNRFYSTQKDRDL